MRKISLTSKIIQKLYQSNHWLDRIAQSRQINGQHLVELPWKLQSFFGGQLLDSSMMSSSTIGWILHGWKPENVDQHWRTDFSVMQQCIKDFLNENLYEQKMESSISRILLRPHFIKGARSVFLWRPFQFIRARRENIEMVKWIGKFSLLPKRLKDAWTDMLPMSHHERGLKTKPVSSWCGENEDRRSRNQELLDPEAPEIREGWSVTQMVNHEALFPFSDNLTTMMFIVASDQSEGQRERLTSSLFFQGVEVTDLWNCSAHRKVHWRILHSEWTNTAVIRAEPSSLKMLLMNLGNWL